jgi:hypothetical protein
MNKVILFSLFSVIFFSGCIQEVKPWEKETLAKKTMEDGALNPINKQFEEHIYFSKEASKGGGGVAGGGCGCN